MSTEDTYVIRRGGSVDLVPMPSSLLDKRTTWRHTYNGSGHLHGRGVKGGGFEARILVYSYTSSSSQTEIWHDSIVFHPLIAK